MVYRWKAKSHIRLNPQVVGELLEIMTPTTPEAVLEAAAVASSPLHGYFEWDDTEAAHRWRLTQASHLLRCIVLERKEENLEPIRALEVVIIGEESVYQPITTIMRDSTLRQQVLDRAWNELKSHERKYADYQEFSSVHAVIRAAVAERDLVPA